MPVAAGDEFAPFTNQQDASLTWDGHADDSQLSAIWIQDVSTIDGASRKTSTPTGQDFTTESDITSLFDTQEYDTNSYWDGTLVALVAPATGTYEVTAAFRISGSSNSGQNSDLIVEVYNDSDVLQYEVPGFTTEMDFLSECIANSVVELSAGWYCKVRFFHAYGS